MISEKVKNYIAEQSFCSEFLFKDSLYYVFEVKGIG